MLAGNTYLNPPGLVTPNGCTHVVVGGDRRTAYIAGQVGFDSTGKVVGGADFKAQAEQAYANLGRALDRGSCRAGPTPTAMVKIPTTVPRRAGSNWASGARWSVISSITPAGAEVYQQSSRRFALYKQLQPGK